jgi:dimethylamine/trimethylamine dehydrogenase
LGNVSLYPGSEMGADDLMAMEHPHIVIATGARWTRHLYSSLEIPVGKLEHAAVYTPDDIARGTLPEGPVLVYDFDNYYLGGLLAEHLADQGLEVSYATPAGHASAWTVMTNELPYVHQALASRGISVTTLSLLKTFDGSEAGLANIFTGERSSVGVKSVVIVGHREPNDAVYHALMAREDEFADAGIKSVTRIGDALAPGAIVHAVHSGHLYARNLDNDAPDIFLRDMPISEFPPGPAYS